MNESNNKNIESPHTHLETKKLDSGSVASVMAGRVVNVLNAENLPEGSFVRCKILNPKGGYWGKARFLDIPKRNLQKVIDGDIINGPIRAIGDDGEYSGGPINEPMAGITMTSYNEETHTVETTGNWGAEFTLEIPVVFSKKESIYPTDDTLKENKK